MSIVKGRCYRAAGGAVFSRPRRNQTSPGDLRLSAAWAESLEPWIDATEKPAASRVAAGCLLSVAVASGTASPATEAAPTLHRLDNDRTFLRIDLAIPVHVDSLKEPAHLFGNFID